MDTARAQSPAAAASSNRDADARSLFMLGQAAYEQGRFEDALGFFQQAFDLSGRASLQYNIAQAADRIRDDRRAVAAFEAYLRDVPDAPQRESVEARLAILRAAIAADDAADAAAAAAADEAPALVESEDDGRSVAPWLLVGGGGAAAVVGAVFLGLGMRGRARVANAADGTWYRDVSEAYESAPTRVTVGSVLLGIGLSATAVGIVLATRSDDDDAPPTVEARLLPNGVVLRGAF
ncbi:MAG: tetratricopeptide repeat protein [Sandaracinaceae bacterium]|nr:tetratricopeptide repeat protein [Sandaracinaceae bacterium]MBK8408454.1 tetratricopeptide repeat protein [Sandaracinaceae bacterium]